MTESWVAKANTRLTCSTYLIIFSDHIHPFMETLYPDALFQQNSTLCHKAKMRNTTSLRFWPPIVPRSPDQHDIRQVVIMIRPIGVYENRKTGHVSFMQLFEYRLLKCSDLHI